MLYLKQSLIFQLTVIPLFSTFFYKLSARLNSTCQVNLQQISDDNFEVSISVDGSDVVGSRLPEQLSSAAETSSTLPFRYRQPQAWLEG